MRTILVLRGGALGDFIVTLPALALLRERWPAARIELAGNVTAGAIARTRGLLDTVHSQHEARWSALFAPAHTPLPAGFAGWLAEFDLVVNYWPDPDGDLRRQFPIRAGQTFVSATAIPECAPAAAHYCEALREVGLNAHENWFRLAPCVAASAPPNAAPPCVAASVSEWDAANRPLAGARGYGSLSHAHGYGSLAGARADGPLAHARGYIAVHPGSGSVRKNWPAENWRALIPQLPAPVSLVLGEAELERWRPMSPSGFSLADIRSNHSGADTGLDTGFLLNILAAPPLEELIAHLSRARLFLGHDSGVSHLAAACGVPCILLFGPTDPTMWAPPAPHVRVLRRGADLASISVSEVQAAVTEALADRT